MLKLTGLDAVFAAAGNLYLLLALVGVCIALWKGRTWALKLLFAVLVLAAFIAPIAPEIYRGVEYRNRLATAQSMFAERCKTAGEKIYKTVEGVEGVYLMKVRSSEINFGEQFKLDDPYGKDSGDYIRTFVRGSYQAETKNIPTNGPPRLGYSYVEAQDPKDGQRYRYTGHIEEPWLTNKSYSQGYTRFVLDKVPATGSASRYGVTYDDISTHEEREYWIAGSSLKVVDLQTNEVIAERIGYMVDWAQGSRAGQRSPWLFAANNACPDFYRNYKNLTPGPNTHASMAQSYQTLDFVEKVLKPTK